MSHSTTSPLKDDTRKTLNPIIILMGILFLAMAMSYVIDSGSYERNGKNVVAGSYQTLKKDSSLASLFEVGAHKENVAPVSIVDTLMAIPEGLDRGAGLIFMVLIIGGMFGILQKAGAID